jgi:hypothetical protein
MRVVAHAVRSGIAALNVVTAALDSDPRTRELEAIASDVAAAVARLESRGAAYGQWRQQAQIASELVQLRRARPARDR